MLPGREHCDRELGVVDRAGGEDDRVDVVAARTTRRRCTRATPSSARRPPRRAPAGPRRPPTSSAPGVRRAFSAWTVPIPPRPATPSRKGRVALDTARATMAASQSLAQSISKPGVERAAGTPCAYRRPSPQGDPCRRRRGGRRLGVDGLARPKRPRRACTRDPRRRAGRGRELNSSRRARTFAAHAADLHRRLRRARRLQPVLRSRAQGRAGPARASRLPRDADGLRASTSTASSPRSRRCSRIRSTACSSRARESPRAVFDGAVGRAATPCDLLRRSHRRHRRRRGDARQRRRDRAARRPPRRARPRTHRPARRLAAGKRRRCAPARLQRRHGRPRHVARRPRT